MLVTSAHARPDVRNLGTSGNGCVQSPSFSYHVTKKRVALGTRMLDVKTMFTYSHANTPLGQSERAYYLSYFIKYFVSSIKMLRECLV